MKTRIFAIMAGILLLSTTSVSAQNVDGKETSKFSSHIESAMYFPDFVSDLGHDGIVNVLIELDENKEMRITQIWGNDFRLVKFVERRVKRMAKKHGPFTDLKDDGTLVTIRFNLAS